MEAASRLCRSRPVSPINAGALVSLIAQLIPILALEDAEQALAGFLSHLRADGLLVDTDEVATELELAAGEQRLSVRLSPNSSDDATRIVRNLLWVALQRIEEQRKQRQATERMQMLSSASFEGLMINEGGMIIDANERLAELLRANPEDLLGDWPLRNCVSPEDRPEVIRRISEGYEGSYVINAIRKDGTRFRAELLSKQGKLGARPIRIAAVRDVTERERTLALLRESEAHLRDLAETVFDITVLSQNGRVIDVAGKVVPLFGYAAEEVIGRPVMDFVALSSQHTVKQMIAEHKSCRYEATMVHRDGELIPIEIVAIDSTVEGKLTRVSGIRDLRAVRHDEAERVQLQRQVERSARLDSLGVLAGGIAHDFNNLLVGVLGNADLLLMEATEPNTRETIEAIITAAEQAAALTARLLAYAGRGEAMQRQPVELGLLLRELCVVLAPKLSKTATLVFDIQSDGSVLADKSALSQVLMNLLTNASEALGDTPGHIEICVKHVQEPDPTWEQAYGASVKPGSWLLVEIRDSGAGMDGATLERIFEPFFTTKHAGHGLGLAACLGIVSALGGAIRVESERSKGSCFALLLPSTERSEIVTEMAQSLRASTPCRVLIIDDEAIVRGQLRRSLELRGYEVCEANCGTAGIAAYETSTPDLIILDTTMPDLDGAEVVNKLRARGAMVPILLASGYVDAATERRVTTGFRSRLLAQAVRYPRVASGRGKRATHSRVAGGAIVARR